MPVVAVEAQANGLPCYFSDRVTAESKLTTATHFLSVKTGITEWAEHIISKNVVRNDKAFLEIKRNGYCIDDVASKLIIYYLN